MPMKPQAEDPLGRYLAQTDDPTLLVLRAHLLIEGRLHDILAGACRAPAELAPVRLTFYQVIGLSRAIIGRRDEPAWDFAARLNEVRNRMAHHLEPGSLDDLIGSVTAKLGP